MPSIEPKLVPVVTDLERGLREIGVPFAVVGALVPELLLDAKPFQATNDADITVIVETLEDYAQLKERLERYGFKKATPTHRMRHRNGGLLDILPYSKTLVPEGRLKLEDGFDLNMAGFDKVITNAVQTAVEGGPTLPVAPLPLYSLLKLVAFADRKKGKDLAGVLHCLEHYLENDDRRYDAEHEGRGVPYEYTGAFLLGVDASGYLDERLSQAVGDVLELFVDTDAEVVAVAAKERYGLLASDSDRGRIWDLFQWYRHGTGL
jgi:predicted nucleotidyltransferase